MYAVGIDVGGMSIKIGIVDDSGRIVADCRIKTIGSPDEIVSLMAESVVNLLNEAKISRDLVSGIGIGFPGIVDGNKGEVEFLPNVCGFEKYPIVARLKKYIDIPIKISNDANLAALGEVTFGVAKDYKNAVMFTLGTGVGGGVVIDGKLFEGWQSKGAELGHVTLISGGELCGCGRRGCVEAYASASALVRQTKQKMLSDKDSLMWKYVNGDIDAVDGTTACECAKQKDPSAIAVYDQYVCYLGDSILNMLNTFRPEVFILGGGISNHGKFLIDKLLCHCEKYSFGIKGAPKTEILIANLKNNAGIIGAACLFLNKNN